jgi:superfamily II DNA or RNA helicase
MVQTYAWMQRNYLKFRQDHFNYIAVDEAHHSVAPGLKKVIQHFNPDTLLGMTATPERLDMKKLEEIFGEYETDMTLKEAIEKEILSPIKAFRVKSNLDLSAAIPVLNKNTCNRRSKILIVRNHFYLY